MNLGVYLGYRFNSFQFFWILWRMFIPKWLEMRGNGPVRSFKKNTSPRKLQHTPLSHTPGNQRFAKLWKESLYSLLVKVQGCIPKVLWNNLRHFLMRFIFRGSRRSSRKVSLIFLVISHHHSLKISKKQKPPWNSHNPLKMDGWKTIVFLWDAIFWGANC